MFGSSDAKSAACKRMEEIVSECMNEDVQKCHDSGYKDYVVANHFKNGRSLATKGLVDAMRGKVENFDFNEDC